MGTDKKIAHGLTPTALLERTGKYYPKLNLNINANLHLREEFDWRREIFFPLSVWGSLLQHIYYNGQALERRFLTNEVYMTAFAQTWAYSKRTHRFDRDLAEALLNSNVVETFPLENYLRLPDFCVHIDFDGFALKIGEQLITGFMVMLDSLFEEKKPPPYETNLMLYLLGRGYKVLTMRILPLDATDFMSAIEVQRTRLLPFKNDPETAAVVEDIQKDEVVEYKALLPFLIYILSEGADIVHAEKFKPFTLTPTKTKKGLKIFPADRVKISKVGETIGNEIRAFKRSLDASSDKHLVAPHFRSGHMALRWVGEGRKNTRYVWIRPTFVKGSKSVEGIVTLPVATVQNAD